MMISTAIQEIQNWIDKYANLNTFLGLIVGTAGLILAKKQRGNTKQKKEDDTFSEPDEPYLGVLIKVDHISRRFVSYGASCGEIVQAGNFKANYEVEAELTIIIQNESPETIYGLEVSFMPNEYAKKYILIDSRDNKLEPLEGNKHFDYQLRITKQYYDLYAREVDRDIHEINKVGKGVSILNGSSLIVKFKDSKHKVYAKTERIN